MAAEESLPELSPEVIYDPARVLLKAIRLAHDANEHFLGLLRRPPPPSETPTPFAAAVARHGPNLSEECLRLAARAPFLLYDFCFSEPNVWAEWARGRPAVRGRPVRESYWDQASAESLSRATATIAWFICSQNPRHARLTLGATASVAAAIGSLQLRDVFWISSEHSARLRPRWESHPSFWERYLGSCCAGDELAQMRLGGHGLQMMAGSVLKRTSTPLLSGLRGVDPPVHSQLPRASASSSAPLSAESALPRTTASGAAYPTTRSVSQPLSTPGENSRAAT